MVDSVFSLVPLVPRSHGLPLSKIKVSLSNKFFLLGRFFVYIEKFVPLLPELFGFIYDQR